METVIIVPVPVHQPLYRLTEGGTIMFQTFFWVLAIWFIINVIWMWFQLNNKTLQKTFAWVNVVAVIIGFWVYYGVTHDAGGIAPWFLTMNWGHVIIAIIQFYFGYRKNWPTISFSTLLFE